MDVFCIFLKGLSNYIVRYALVWLDILDILYDARLEETDLKVFVVVMPKEGWARVVAPILLLV